MEKLRITDVIKANETGINPVISRGLERLAFAERIYPKMILEAVRSGNLGRQINLAYTESQNDPRAALDNPLTSTAGAYFINEDVIGGSREREVLAYTNAYGEALGFKPLSQKIKLGPGIGFVEAPRFYQQLKTLGLGDQNLTINYTSPFGTSETRRGIKRIVDAKFNPESDFIPDDGVFLTRGATEGIDLFMDTIATLKPNSRVVFLGLSYYTGPFSAFQKRLKIDRLVKRPKDPSRETKFFPITEDIASSLPPDTSALVLTMPNNPNGETYDDDELRKLFILAKERGLFVLFDAIFENMYFDGTKNYQSSVLQAALTVGALDNVVIVDSLSKTMNFPGERVGFLATTNQLVKDTLTDIVLARMCNPPLTLEPVIQFEGLARRIKNFQVDSPNTGLSVVIDKALEDTYYPMGKDSVSEMYMEWDKWNTEALKFYRGNLEITRAILNGSLDGTSPDQAAFNTLVRLKGLPADTNNMDYLAKLMFTLATYTQVGPCFGLSQRTWDETLGVWSRITYACSREDLIEGVIRLVIFNRFYAEADFGNPNKFPVLDISYKDQI